jgi:formiminotetrahydrofolate cyclodeaminase
MSFAAKTISEFIDALASKEPVPGGGSASALAGAVGAALGNMTGSLTAGKKKFAHIEAEIAELKKKADVLQEALLTLIDRDAEAFAPLGRAYALPNDTPDRRTEKDRVMEAALYAAALTPLSIMENCARAIDIIEIIAAKGSKLVISDAGAGAVFCKAAMIGASLSLFINTKTMKDRVRAEKLNKEADELLAVYEAKADSIFAAVKKQLR